MKVAFIVSGFPRISETFILNQITGLIDLGHEVKIFAIDERREEQIPSAVIKYNLESVTVRFVPASRIKRVLEAIKLTIKNLKNFSYLIKAFNFWKYGKDATGLKLLYLLNAVGDDGFDIIHCHYGFNGRLGAYLKDIGKAKRLVTTFHGCDIRKGLTSPNFNLYRTLRDRGDCFISISPYNLRSLKKMGFSADKVVNIPVGIDVNIFSPSKINYSNSNEKQIRILTVARLVEEKGLKYAIRSLYRLKNKGCLKNILYTIVGSGPLKGRLSQLVQELDLGDAVCFAGPLLPNGVLREMRKADIFLLSSVAEALPVVLMEAQSVCLPVVATDVGSVKSIISEKTGYVVPPRRDDLLADKLLILINDHNLRLSMGVLGRASVKEKYDIRTINKNIVNTYKKLLKS